MATARYWRLTAFGTFTGGSDLELSAAQLYGVAGRADASATITSAIAPTSGSVANLQDSDLTTVARWSTAEATAPGFAINWDFGSDTEVVGARVGTGAAKDTAAARYTLEYFDGTRWQLCLRTADVAYPGANALTALDGAGDPFYSFVALLLHGDGTNGSTTLTDSSLSGIVPTAYGNVQISTAVKKFGTGSIAFDGNGDYLSIDSPKMNLAQNMDYSVDGWFYIGGTAQALWSTFQSQPRGRANCVIDSGGTISFGEQDADGGNSVTITSSSSFPLNQWVFVRCAKFGTAMNLYVNGTLVATGTSPVRTNFADHIHIGTFDPTSSAYYYWLNGYIDDFRVTVGSARDTGSSAAPTAAAPNVEMFPFVAQDKKTRIYATKTCASSFAPDGSHGMTLVAPMIDHLGNQGAFGTITGTVKVSDTPSNDPVHRRVRLYRDRDGVMVAETWSDATTGAYTFNEVDSAFKYTVIAYDYEHNYRAVAADNITAVTA